MDVVTGTYAINVAKEYADSLALNGVPVKNPQIDPVSKHWLVFNPVANTYVDTGTVAEGKDGDDGDDGITPHIDPVTKHWFIGDHDTGIIAEGGTSDGANIESISNKEIQDIFNSIKE